jgi:hypothetical protein
MADTTIKKEAFAALKSLADFLKVDLKDTRTAVATPLNDASVRMFDGSLEARIVPTSSGTVYITSPRAPGIMIDLVNHQKDGLAPPEAIYCITSYMPLPDQGGAGEVLNGDVYSVYVGANGIILDDSALRRASELYEEGE